MEMQRTTKAKAISQKNLKTYTIAIEDYSNEAAQYWYKDRYTAQWNKTQNKNDPHIYGQLIFYKVFKYLNNSIINKCCCYKQLDSQTEKINLKSYLMPYTKKSK